MEFLVLAMFQATASSPNEYFHLFLSLKKSYMGTKIRELKREKNDSKM
jgi:hypothetical protein